MSDALTQEGAHTPGPWVSVWGERTTGIIAPDGTHICELFDSARPEDADLISAAPDLLSACEALVAEQVDYMTLNNLGDPEQQHNIRLARAAIAKAVPLSAADPLAQQLGEEGRT